MIKVPQGESILDSVEGGNKEKVLESFCNNRIPFKPSKVHFNLANLY